MLNAQKHALVGLHCNIEFPSMYYPENGPCVVLKAELCWMVQASEEHRGYAEGR